MQSKKKTKHNVYYKYSIFSEDTDNTVTSGPLNSGCNVLVTGPVSGGVNGTGNGTVPTITGTTGTCNNTKCTFTYV